jgi:hypothetical protein
MLGAAPHLMPTFELDERTARAVLTAWAETFDGRQTCDERAAVVVALGSVACAHAPISVAVAVALVAAASDTRRR